MTAKDMLHFRPVSSTYLARRNDQLAKCTVDENWMLITRSGSVGRCVIVGKRLARFAVTDDAIRVVPDETPMGYLYAFLMSWLGQALLTRDQYGSAIKHLESHHVADIPIPLLPECEMVHIADAITRSYMLREDANTLLDEATEELHGELDLPDFDESLVEFLSVPQSEFQPDSHEEQLQSFAVSASALEDRLDASYHIPLARSAVAVMRSATYSVLPLRDMCADIFLPNRFKRTYVNEQYGVPFIQGGHIPLMKPYDLKYIARRDKQNLDKCKIAKDFVLITRSGTVGRIGMFPDLEGEWAASEHLIRLISKSPHYNPGYIALFLMTPYGQHQMLSKIYGAVVDELTVEDMENILIPDAPTDLQDRIGNKVLEAFRAKEQANHLEVSAIEELENRLEGNSPLSTSC